jgi:hypothetical protein
VAFLFSLEKLRCHIAKEGDRAPVTILRGALMLATGRASKRREAQYV